MRSFRTSAVAIATALTVSVTGVSVASAQSSSFPGIAENQTPDSTLSSALSSGATTSSEIGTELDADQPVTGEDLFGEETDAVPAWASEWANLTVVAGIGTVVGLIIAGVNYLKYTGVLPY